MPIVLPSTVPDCVAVLRSMKSHYEYDAINVSLAFSRYDSLQ